MKRRFFAQMILILVLLTGILPGELEARVLAESSILTDVQSNAIAMLNHIAVLTQDINASKNSRLHMEEAYSTLINNTAPNAVDARTLSQMEALLDVMENYRMVAVKRERLQYIYEQNQARGIRAAIPNPLGMLGTIQSFRPSKIAASLAYMAVDSITSYVSYTEETDLQYLKDGWALDDEEASVLHESRKGAFAYMITMVSEYGLPGDFTLSESNVEEFVKWKNNENIVGRIQFLESNQATYRCYGGYWLLLAQSYYDNGEYSKCLDAMDAYERLNIHVFRKDYEMSKVLPAVISAAEEVCDSAEYEALAKRYVQFILDNTDNDDWALRYYAAQVYVDLSAQTNNSVYLENAYSIILDNVNYLVDEQRNLNAAYLAPVQKMTIPEKATKSEKKQIESANKALEKTRETELPPVCEPLLLNCDLLFALADELNISEDEQQKIDNILHLDGSPIYLTETLDDKYWYNRDSNMNLTDIEVEFGGTAIILPVVCCTKDTQISVSVQELEADASVVLTDWKVDSVERVEESNISSYCVVYTSEEAHNHKWKPGATIHIDIQPKDGTDIQPYHFEFKAEGTKNEWYDYLKIWEGHKNNWYDYAKVWENSVEFKRVK